MSLPSGSRLGRYEVSALIGEGGMGQVYRARDSKLDRDVAIKILPETLASDPERIARFEREARMLAALNHPNIGAIYGFEDTDGVRALVLELVDGETLADRIQRGPLPLKDALTIARQIADALEAAHEKGIVHRDLKPANVKITPDGAVKVLDFGVAKIAARDASAFDRSNSPTVTFSGTREGLILGTVAYMSPEQARGQPLDQRTDVWALGCVLFEMASGRVAFGGLTPPDTIAAILGSEPAWHALPHNTPTDVLRLLRRCLDKTRAGRMGSMAELRTVLATALIAPQADASIAVLPFANLSADKENEYFGDGLAEEIINALTQVAGLRVIARTSAFAFRDKPEDVRRIAETLGVINILQGSVRKSGPRIRVATQLIAGSDGTQVWSNRYDRDLTEVFAVQDEIAQAVVHALRDRLGTRGAKHIVQRQTANIDAYHRYVRGRHYFYSIEPADMDAGRRLFEEAVAIDPTYASPLVDLAHYYWVNTMTRRIPSHEGATKGIQAAKTALTLDPASGEAMGFLARFKALYEYRWTDALADLERAMEMNPASGVTGQGHAVVFAALNRLSEALHQQEHALKADPFSPLNHYFMARLCTCIGDSRKAFEHANRAIEIAPESWLARGTLGLVQLRNGRIREAVRSLEATKSGAPVGFVTSGWLGCAYALAGETAKAEAVVQELRRAASPVPAAMIHSQLGNSISAFELLRAAVRERDLQLYGLQVEPAFEGLRAQAEYQDLLHSMNL